MNTNMTPPPANFDPWSQNVTLKYQDGSNFTISFAMIENHRLNSARMAIGLGSQIGASWLLLLVLLLLTSSKKYKSSIFITNALCLTTNAIRCILLASFTTNPINRTYAQLSGDYSRVTPSNLATLVAGNVLTLLVTTLVLLALSLQVWVVCVTTMPLQRSLIMATTTIFACLTVAFKAAMIITSIKISLGRRDTVATPPTIIIASHILQALTIWLYSSIFTYKLGYAIVQRRKLNMPAFGPMQIVFTMGCQTMLIPALFATLQFRSDTPELTGMVLTVVTIFLPLSALWAGVANEVATSPGATPRRALLQGAFCKVDKASEAGSCASGSVVGESRSSDTLSVPKGEGEICMKRKYDVEFGERV